MRFQDRVNAVGLRSAMALPAPVQRLLAGRRVELDGQRLAVDTQLMLRLQALTAPAAETLPIPRGRVVIDRMSATVGGRQPIGAVRDLPVAGMPGRLYTPTGATGALPVLVFLHGGGFIYGGLDSHDATCRVLAEQAHVRVLAVDYRLAPEHPFPAAHDDALAAYRWAIEHVDELGGDPERIAVGGDSAGGNLAAAVALAAAQEGLPLAFQLLVYPATDSTRCTESRRLFGEGFWLTRAFMDLATGSYLPDAGDHRDPRASPLLAEVPPGTAPAYVATAGFDPLRDEGEAYARHLAAAGVDVELRRFPDQVHSFFNVVAGARGSRAAIDEIAVALRRGLSVDR